MATAVAVIGCGVMGTSIATRLIEKGHAVHVFDIDPSKRAAIAEKGATACNSAADAARSSNIVILSLNSGEIVRRAMFDADGVADGAAPQTLIIDMSSIDPVSTRTIADEA